MNQHRQFPPPAPGPACSTFAPLLPLVAHGLLDPEQSQQLQEHLADCAYCHVRLAGHDRLDRALRRHFERQGNASLRTQEILGRIRVEEGLEEASEEEPPLAHPPVELPRAALRVPTRPRQPSTLRRALPSWVATVAAVLVIALLTTGLVTSRISLGRLLTGKAPILPTASLTLAPTFTPTPEANPYPPYTGKLLWDDPLTDNSQGHNWEGGTPRSSTVCQFSGGALQLVTAPQDSNTCFEHASAGIFSNFALQVNVTFAQSSSPQDQAGIVFREGDASNPGRMNYLLALYASGQYALTVCVPYLTGSDCSKLVFQGMCQVCRSGSSQVNTLAVVANGSSLAFYVNGRLQASGTDATYSQGLIGFYSSAFSSSTIIAYQDVKVWQF